MGESGARQGDFARVLGGCGSVTLSRYPELSMSAICVFCGSSKSVPEVFFDVARETGRALASAGWTVVYGGARNGLMGALAKSALEAGGRVVGVIPRALVEWEVAYEGLSEMHIVETLQERKALMAELSEAFLTLPGGFGTLDELFEVLTWAILRLHDKPCVLVNTDGFYDHLLAFAKRAGEAGFVTEESGRRLLVAPDPRAALHLIGERCMGIVDHRSRP
jgi:uncharacterized protein (TIGR00730 family)